MGSIFLQGVMCALICFSRTFPDIRSCAHMCEIVCEFVVWAGRGAGCFFQECVVKASELPSVALVLVLGKLEGDFFLFRMDIYVSFQSELELLTQVLNAMVDFVGD